MDAAVQNLHIKISGCFNSCGQHHVADLGFYGVSRKMAGYAVPHFQVVLGGEWENNAGSYGLPVVAVPSKNIPEVVTRLTDRYVADRILGTHSVLGTRCSVLGARYSVLATMHYLRKGC